MAICIVAFAMRLPNLGRSLWLDEAYSAWFSAAPLHELWHSVPLYETHPPMYYTLLKGWSTLFGTSEAALRGMSLLASLLTVLLLAVSGRLLRAGPIGDRVALLAALFLSFNKGHIQYSQQARPYGLETLTVSLAILFSVMLLRAMREQAGRSLVFRPLLPSILGLGAAAGMTLWLHNTAILICFGIWTGMVVSVVTFLPGKRWMQALAVGIPGVLALLIWSPFVPMFIAQNTNLTAQAYWITMKWSDPLTAMSIATGGQLSLIPVGLIAALGFAKLWRMDRVSALNLAIVLVLPLSILLAYSYLRTPVYINRLFEWLSPPTMVLAALGVIVGLPQVALRKWAALFVAGICFAQACIYFSTPTENWRAMFGYIATHAQPGDLVIASPNEIDLPLRYYVHGGETFPDVLHVPAMFPALGLEGRIYVGNLGAPKINEADIGVVRAALQTHKRVWFIERSGDLYDPKGMIRGEILTSRKLVERLVDGSPSMELFEQK